MRARWIKITSRIKTTTGHDPEIREIVRTRGKHPDNERVRARVHAGGFPFTTLSPYPAFRRLGQRQHLACLERRAEPSPQPRRHAVPVQYIPRG
jgi:hypothetical protein